MSAAAPFGDQTVTFVAVTENLTVRDRYNQPTKVRAETAVANCRFRPLTAQESIELGDIVQDPYKCTAPPVAAVLSASANDEVKVAGVTYQIVGGVRVFPDLEGDPFKVTIIVERRLS